MQLDVAFDLDFSLCCGQVFRWKKTGDWWYGIVGDNVCKIRQCGNKLEYQGVSEDFVRNYFGLNDDLEQISQCISKDDYIRKALSKFAGLRIVRQVSWECLISFICATYKSIAAIELMLRKISEKYGQNLQYCPFVEYLNSANNIIEKEQFYSVIIDLQNGVTTGDKAFK